MPASSALLPTTSQGHPLTEDLRCYLPDELGRALNHMRPLPTDSATLFPRCR